MIPKDGLAYLERHVIGAGGQEAALRVPFDGVHLVLVALERFDWLREAESTNMNLLIRAARGEAVIVLPVDVESRRCVKGELLLTSASLGVPNDCGLFEEDKQETT